MYSEELFARYPFLKYFAQSFAWNDVEYDEILSAAILGLTKGLKKHNPDLEIALEPNAFLFMCAQQEVSKCFQRKIIPMRAREFPSDLQTEELLDKESYWFQDKIQMEPRIESDTDIRAALEGFTKRQRRILEQRLIFNRTFDEMSTMFKRHNQSIRIEFEQLKKRLRMELEK